MYLFLITRGDLISFLPKGGTVAEIGVAEGAFSRAIIEKSAPKCLHLIDPWKEFDDAYADDVNNKKQAEMDERAAAVRQLFDAQITQGQVKIHRCTSAEALDRFEDGALDWVYIDGNHTYEAVRGDLSNYWDKVGDDGFILGHDYTNHAAYRAMGFGVVEAVNEFCSEKQTPILILTFDAEPTYLLAKNPDAEVTQWLLGTLMQSIHFIEIRDFPGRGMIHKQAQFPSGKTRDFLSF